MLLLLVIVFFPVFIVADGNGRVSFCFPAFHSFLFYSRPIIILSMNFYTNFLLMYLKGAVSMCHVEKKIRENSLWKKVQKMNDDMMIGNHLVQIYYTWTKTPKKDEKLLEPYEVIPYCLNIPNIPSCQGSVKYFLSYYSLFFIFSGCVGNMER